jgi:hypothetical protein
MIMGPSWRLASFKENWVSEIKKSGHSSAGPPRDKNWMVSVELRQLWALQQQAFLSSSPVLSCSCDSLTFSLFPH